MMRTIAATHLRNHFGIARRMCSSAEYVNILKETRGAVGLVTINRPKALNALSPDVVTELVDAFTAFDKDESIGAIVLTGSGDKAFVAGADIKVMADQTYMDMFKAPFMENIDQISNVKKPIIAAVNGFALGGGCELAMACDFILAADTAKFGQPEIKLGTIPGLGGTQRLTRAVGKARAMELTLTGDMISAQEAASIGLVSRVVPSAELLDDALKTAEKIAAFSQPIVAMAKICVNAAFETTLKEGIRLERSLFYSTFATNDQKEGMRAFVAKERPSFKNK